MRDMDFFHNFVAFLVWNVSLQMFIKYQRKSFLSCLSPYYVCPHQLCLSPPIMSVPMCRGKLMLRSRVGGWVGGRLVKSDFRSHSGSHQSPAWIQNPSWSRVWQQSEAELISAEASWDTKKLSLLLPQLSHILRLS